MKVWVVSHGYRYEGADVEMVLDCKPSTEDIVRAFPLDNGREWFALPSSSVDPGVTVLGCGGSQFIEIKEIDVISPRDISPLGYKL